MLGHISNFKENCITGFFCPDAPGCVGLPNRSVLGGRRGSHLSRREPTWRWLVMGTPFGDHGVLGSCGCVRGEPSGGAAHFPRGRCLLASHPWEQLEEQAGLMEGSRAGSDWSAGKHWHPVGDLPWAAAMVPAGRHCCRTNRPAC